MAARRRATAVRIYCPVAAATLAALLAGDGAALERDPVLARMLDVIRRDPHLGDFGLYRGVVEVAPGWESFRATAAAAPTLGAPGQLGLSSTVIVTSYAPAEADLDATLAALVAAHPWEVPVIEVYATELLLRA